MCIKANQTEAPKERQPVATGASPWNWVGENFRPEGAVETPQSVKNVSFFKLDFVRAQKFQQLITERFGTMMLFLALDIVPNFFNLRLAYGKDAVAFLPRKRAQVRKRFMNPAGRVCLHISNERGQGFISPPTEQDVNMVGNAADFQNVSTFAANDAAEIIVNARADVRCEPRLAMFRAEDEVKLQVVKCPGHEGSLTRRPVGAEEVCLNRSPRVSLRSTRGYRPTLLRSGDRRCKTTSL